MSLSNGGPSEERLTSRVLAGPRIRLEDNTNLSGESQMNHRSIKRLFWLVTAFIVAAVAFVPALPALAQQEARFDVKFSGVIMALPAPAADAPYQGEWNVAGHAVAVDARTRLHLTLGKVETGMWADVMARRGADGGLVALQVAVLPPEVRLKGLVTARPEDPNGVGDWTIAGQTITVTAETRISERGGPVDLDHWVEVYALEQDGGLVAQRMRGIEPMPAVEIFGAIQGADPAWMISTIPVAYNQDTLFHGEPATGLLAHVAANLGDDGSLLALRWNVLWVEPNSTRPDVSFVGTIKALPEEGLEGVWTVDEQAVVVDANTDINQMKGLVALSAKVHVVGWQDGEQVLAMRITVLASPDVPSQYRYIRGLIEALPTGGLLGEWTVDGHQFQVTRRTRLANPEAAQIGAFAEAALIRLRDGSVVAVWVRVRAAPGPGPQPSRTPGPGPQSSCTPGSGPQPSRTPGSGPQPSRTPGRP